MQRHVASARPARPNPVLLVFLALAYCGALQWTYAEIVSHWYDYKGFVYEAPPFLRLASCYLFASLPAAWLAFGDSRPSHLIVTLLYLMTFAPACMIPGLTAGFEPWLVLKIQVVLLAGFGLILASLRLPLPRGRLGDGPRRLFVPVFGAFAAICVAACLYEFGFKLQIHALDDVYDVRSDFTDGLANVGMLGRYGFGWLANVVGPVLLMLGWKRRQIPVIALGVLIELWLFSLTGRKSFLFSIVLVFAILAAIRRNRSAPAVPWMVGGAVVMVAGCALFDIACGRGTYYLTLQFMRRMFQTPGLLTGHYFEYFSGHKLALYGNGILKGFVTPRYSEPTGVMIARVYFGEEATNNACANIFADGFANLGVGGVLLMSAGLAAFLRVYDWTTRGIDLRLAVAPLILPSIALSNGSLLTSLFTHGMLLGLVVARHFPAEGGVGQVAGLSTFIPRKNALSRNEGRPNDPRPRAPLAGGWRGG